MARGYSVEQPYSLQTEGCICRCSRTGACEAWNTIIGFAPINYHVCHHCVERTEHSGLYSGRRILFIIKPALPIEGY